MTWRRVAALALGVGAVVLTIGEFSTWSTSEGGIPPTVSSPSPVSEDGGWTLLVAAGVCALSGIRLLAERSRPWLWGLVGILAAVWAILAALSITDPAALGNVGDYSLGPARRVMVLGIVLCFIGGLAAVALSAARVARPSLSS